MTNPNTKPCGCTTIEMDDGTSQISPCVSCGMMEAAKAMNSVAQIFAAIATRLKVEKESPKPKIVE